MRCYLFLSLLLICVQMCVGQQQVQFNPDPSPQSMDQCILVNQSNLGSMPTSLYAPDCIEFNDQNPTSIVVDESPNLFHAKAGKSIHISPNVHLKPNTHFEIDEDPDYTLAWYIPGTVGVVPQYTKMEIGLKLSNELQSEVDNFFDNDPSNGDGLNPFNRHDIDIQMNFFINGQPVDRSDAFYYVPQKIENDNFVDDTTSFNFRFRHSPRYVGSYTAEIELLIGDQRINTSYIQFEVTESDEKGFLEKGNYNYHLRYSKTKESFFGVGQCIPWASIPGDQKVSASFLNLNDKMGTPLEVLKEHEGNFTRFVAAPWSLQFETEALGNYNPKRDHAWYLDKLTEFCDDQKVYFIYCMKLHTDVMSGIYDESQNGGWLNNVYNSFGDYVSPYPSEENIPPVSTVLEFFTKDSPKDHYKNYLRYIVSRYGYSTSVAGWQLLSEINDADGYKDDEPGVRNAVHTWIDEMAAFLDTVQFDRHLTSVAATGDDAGTLDYVEDFGLFNSPYIDFTGVHTYTAQDPGSNTAGKMRNRGLTAVYTAVRNLTSGSNGILSSNPPMENRNMPFIFDEYGAVITSGDQNGLSIYNEFNVCNGHGFHNDLWTSMCSGSAIPGLDWPASDYPDKWFIWEEEFHGIKKFFQDIDFETVNYNHFYYDNNAGGRYAAQRWPFTEDDILKTNYQGQNKDYQHEDALEGYTMISKDKSQGFGWLHNRSHYWYNLPPYDPCMNAMVNGLAPWSSSVVIRPEDDDNLTSGHRQVQINEDYIKVRNLQPNQYYKIEFYHPQTDDFMWLQIRKASVLGKLTISPPEISSVHEDVAFKFELYNEWNKSNNSIDTTSIHSYKVDNDVPPVLEVYPNPNTGSFRIHSEVPILSVSIENYLGELVVRKEDIDSNHVVILENFAAGVYLLKIALIGGDIITRKITVQ